jgi:hypothetical protein
VQRSIQDNLRPRFPASEGNEEAKIDQAREEKIVLVVRFEEVA